MATDPNELLKNLVEQGRSIKFGRGVVGKTSYATVAVLGLWAVVLFRLSSSLWLNLGLFAAAAIATGIYFWWVRGTQRFAKENPGLAMLEGAQLIEYQKWEAEVKGVPGPLTGRVIPNPQQKLSVEGDSE